MPLTRSMPPDKYDQHANAWAFWYMHVVELAIAAESLRQHQINEGNWTRLAFVTNIAPGFPLSGFRGTGVVEHMLWALAIEDMIKCIYLKQGNKLAEGGKLLPGWDKHNLREYARKIRLPLSEEQSNLLDELSFLLKSWARYPVGKTAEGTPESWSWTNTDSESVYQILKLLFATIK